MNLSPYPHSERTIVVEVIDAQGAGVRHSLSGTSIIVGRQPGVTLQLPRDTVSRKHVEIIAQPDGRWSVRDLSSRNGTRVNGVRTAEHTLSPGDYVEVGEFGLRVVSLDGKTAADNDDILPGAEVPITDAFGSDLSTLQDLQLPRVAASNIRVLSDLVAELMRLERALDRLTALCRVLVRDDFHGRAAMVIRIRRDRPQDAPRVLCGPVGGVRFPGWTPYLSRTVLRAIREQGQSVLAGNTSLAGPVGTDMSISPDVVAMAAVACPLRSDDATIDLLYVVLPPEFGTGEWLALADMAARQHQQAESLWVARREREAHVASEASLREAREIQHRLLPAAPSSAVLEVSIGFRPCHQVGGDYVDVIPTADGRVLLVIADVCGKGLPAALLASAMHATLHVGTRAGISAADLFRHLNDHLCRTLGGAKFVTAAALLLDPATGIIEYLNAGHPAPLVVGPDGRVRALPAGENHMLGVCDEIPVASAARLDDGHALLLYTDGLTDTRSAMGTRLGDAAFYSAAGSALARAPSTDAAAAALEQFLDLAQGEAPAVDDRTFLIARRRHRKT